MAEYYTVALNNTTGVEITGGRVGHFTVAATDGFYLGEAAVSSGSGASIPGGLGNPHTFYVTSPDEVYAVLGSDPSGTMRVFQNR